MNADQQQKYVDGVAFADLAKSEEGRRYHQLIREQLYEKIDWLEHAGLDVPHERIVGIVRQFQQLCRLLELIGDKITASRDIGQRIQSKARVPYP